VRRHDGRALPRHRCLQLPEGAGVENHQGAALLHARAHEHRPVGAHRQATQALAILDGLDGVQQTQAPKAVHIDFSVHHDDHQVPPKPHRPHCTSKAELGNRAGLSIIPQNHLVRLVLRASAAPGKGQDVGAEEHGDDAEAASGREVSAPSEAKGIRAVDPEAGLCPASETSVVLVEGDIQKLVQRITL